jgi:hypothetical protein
MTFLDNSVSIMEEINLAGVKAGQYEIIAVPLRFRRGDAAPCRAVIRPLKGCIYMKTEFWARLDELIRTSEIIIDRPKGMPHPRYPDLIFPLDYGYLKCTSSGGGIDIWLGTASHRDHRHRQHGRYEEKRCGNQAHHRLYRGRNRYH